MIQNLPSQVRLHELLQKNNKSKQEQEELIIAIKKGNYDMPDVSFDLTYKLVKSKQNTSDQKYINLQQLILNGIRVKIPSISIKQYLQQFARSIGKTPYIQKLLSLLNFTYDKQIKVHQLQSLLKQDLTDLQTRKRLLTSYKRQGRIDEYIKKLNVFLEENSSDTQAWLELSHIYNQRGLYLRALFCMEEVLVQHPQNDHYMVKLAELYVTLGGKQNIKHAIKYFSHVVSRYPKNTRALWGLYRTLQSQGDKIEAENVELRQLCNETIHKQYSKRNPKIKIHVAF